MFARTCGIAAAFSLFVSASAHAALTCNDVKAALAGAVVDVDCFDSTDLTTNGPRTTPVDNAVPPGTPPGTPPLPPFAFTPQTDRSVISPKAGDRTPITKAVPGIQLNGRIASDPLGQARFLLRLPADWNGRLVVAGASGTRSEYNGDFAWSDYVVQQGYAYASQNKGTLNLRLLGVFLTPAAAAAVDPLACRLAPPPVATSVVWVHFYDNDPGQEFTRWAQFMIQAGQLAQTGVLAAYDRPARFTYAVGTSNGGYQVRRAVELAPKVFDGGVDWEGTFVQEATPNLLTDLPPAIKNYAPYAAGGFDTNSAAAQNIRAAGYPPDIVVGTASFWGNHNTQFWEVTQCQWQKRLDPSYDTYGPAGTGTGDYNYVARLSVSDVGAQMAAFANTGAIQRPLVTVQGTMDALLPINHHARAYARLVADRAKAQRNNGLGADDLRTAYRLYEVQNGNHIETYRDTFSQLEYIEPHAQRAFDVLVDSVERNIPMPPSQCIARSGHISATPAASQLGHCANLFVP